MNNEPNRLREGRVELRMVQIPKPCSADWDAMDDKGKARHCEQCDHLVYDLSQLTKVEAEDLLNCSGKLPCIHAAFAPDGTPITKDYKPTLKTRLIWLAASIIALVLGGAHDAKAQGLTGGGAAPKQAPKLPRLLGRPGRAPVNPQETNLRLGEIAVQYPAAKKPKPTIGLIAPTRILKGKVKFVPVKPQPKPTPKPQQKTKTEKKKPK